MGPDAEDQSEEEYGDGDSDEDQEDEDGEVGRKRIALEDSNEDPSMVRNTIDGSQEGQRDSHFERDNVKSALSMQEYRDDVYRRRNDLRRIEEEPELQADRMQAQSTLIFKTRHEDSDDN